MTAERAPQGWRRASVAVLVVVTTLSMLVVGAAVDFTAVRLAAVAMAIGAGVVSLRLSERRSSLVGWYAITAAVLLYRLVSEAVGA